MNTSVAKYTGKSLQLYDSSVNKMNNLEKLDNTSNR